MTTLLRCCLCAVVMAATSVAQVGIRLTKVPERIALPAAAGQNLVLECEIQGQPGEVWLARDAAATERVPLQSVGAHRFQLNLADRRVARLLPADRNLGDLHVFARRGQQLLQSAAIAWSRSEPDTRVQCVVVEVDGEQWRGPVDGEPWLDPAEVERIEVQGLAMLQAKASAIAGSTTVPFSRRAAEPFTLVMNDGLKRSLWQAGQLGVDVRHGAQSWWFGFRVVPDVLAPEDPRFTVVQRRRGEVPGSRGWLVVRLGDITGGQVLLDVVDGRGRDVVSQRSIGEGGHVEIGLSGGEFVLVVDRLVNRLIGDDHAELRVLPAKDFRPDPIALLIERVGAVEGVKFLREGQEHDGRLAQRFLRARWAAHRDEQLTPEQFLEIASKSSRTGDPYHIRTADGELVTAKQWFGEQLRAVRQQAQAPESSGPPPRRK